MYVNLRNHSIVIGLNFEQIVGSRFSPLTLTAPLPLRKAPAHLIFGRYTPFFAPLTCSDSRRRDLFVKSGSNRNQLAKDRWMEWACFIRLLRSRMCIRQTSFALSALWQDILTCQESSVFGRSSCQSITLNEVHVSCTYTYIGIHVSVIFIACHRSAAKSAR